MQSAADIPSVLERVQERALSHKQKVQPYLLVEGDSLSNPRTYYVVLDSIRYQFESSKKAFDTLFKIFHVLSAKYPIQSEYLWVLIQKVIYEIETPFDQIPAYIKKYLNILDNY